MDRTFWHKQTSEQPLFADLLWSRPESKLHAGKLLIVGGNAFGFAEPAAAYASAQKAGVGVSRMLLPDSLRPFVGKVFEAGELAPSTPSGSFSQRALGELLPMSAWADGVLLAGGFGRNSETAILLEKFLTKYTGPLTITHDGADYFTNNPLAVLRRGGTCLVISFAQLQKLAVKARFPQAFTFDMDMLRLIDTLHDFSTEFPAYIIVKHLDSIFVACNGQVSSTKLDADREVWRVATAAAASVWWLQNPNKPFEALTTSILPGEI